MALTKHTAIEVLFADGWEQKDIARILRISEATVSKYVIKNNLRQNRAVQSLAKKTSEDNALIALEHQSTIIRLIAQKLKEELNDDPDIEALKAALIPKGEIDALQKLFTTIKGRELEWSTVVKIIREFLTYIKDRDIEMAQDLIDPADDFINDKRRLLS